MELIIKGDERKLRRLAKEIRLRVKRDGLEISEGKKLASKVEQEPKKEIVEQVKQTQVKKAGSSKTDTGKK